MSDVEITDKDRDAAFALFRGLCDTGGDCSHGHPSYCPVSREEDAAHAIATARAEGWRSGMEAAAKTCDAVYARIDDAGGHLRYNSTTHEEMQVAERCGDDIRAIIAEKEATDAK